MSGNTLEPIDVLARVNAGIANDKRQCEALSYPIVKLLFCFSFIAMALVGEFLSMTHALAVQFPPQSDGTDLGPQLMSMRWVIVAALLLGDVLVQGAADPNGGRLRRLLYRFRLLPLLAIMGGMAVFMFLTGIQALGGEDGGLVGWALGTVWSSVFAIAFLASTGLVKWATPALRVVIGGLSTRRRIAHTERELATYHGSEAELTSLRRDIAVKEESNVLATRAASKAAAIVGKVASELGGIVGVKAGIAGDERPEDVMRGIPDTPLPVLERTYAQLKAMDLAFFLGLAKKGA